MNPLFILSGPSGSGKTTIVQELLNHISEIRKNGTQLPYSTPRIVTTTTRAPRENEVNGVDYHFISVEAFEEKLENDELVEHVNYLGNYYGMTKEALLSCVKQGPAFVIVEFEGMQEIKKFYENSVTIFVSVSFDDVKKQLEIRNDPEEIRKKRIQAFENEIKNSKEYDYVVENKFGRLNDTLETVKDIVKKYL